MFLTVSSPSFLLNKQRINPFVYRIVGSQQTNNNMISFRGERQNSLQLHAENAQVTGKCCFLYGWLSKKWD